MSPRPESKASHNAWPSAFTERPVVIRFKLWRLSECVIAFYFLFMNFSDPNNWLPDDTVDLAVSCGRSAFYNCGITPKKIDDPQYRSFLYGKLAEYKCIVFVRVSKNGEPDLDDDSVLPPILIDAAEEFDAEPFLFRIGLTTDSNGTFISYRGTDEFIEAIKSKPDYNRRRQLSGMKGRSTEEYLRLTGKISKLTVKVSVKDTDGTELVDMTDFDESVLQVFGELEPRFEPVAISVQLSLIVDDEDISGRASISPRALAEASYRSGSYDIFTCSCGVAMCAGYNRGMEVGHDAGLTVWMKYSHSPSRVYVFDSVQQQNEILRALTEASRLIKGSSKPEKYFGPYEDSRIEIVDKALIRAIGFASIHKP